MLYFLHKNANLKSLKKKKKTNAPALHITSFHIKKKRKRKKDVSLHGGHSLNAFSPS